MAKMNLTDFETGKLQEHEFSEQTVFNVQPTQISGCTIVYLTDGDDMRTLHVSEDRQKVLYIREFELDREG